MTTHVRITDNALAVECVLPCHEAADWILREYGEGPSTLPCIHTAAAHLAAGHITAAHAALADIRGLTLWEER